MPVLAGSTKHWKTGIRLAKWRMRRKRRLHVSRLLKYCLIWRIVRRFWTICSGYSRENQKSVWVCSPRSPKTYCHQIRWSGCLRVMNRILVVIVCSSTWKFWCCRKTQKRRDYTRNWSWSISRICSKSGAETLKKKLTRHNSMKNWQKWGISYVLKRQNMLLKSFFKKSKVANGFWKMRYICTRERRNTMKHYRNS